MIKCKMLDLLKAELPLKKLDDASRDGKLKFEATFKLRQILKAVIPNLQDYYSELNKVIDKYAVRSTEHPDEYSITNEELFNKYFNTLVSFDIDLSNCFPFTSEDFNNGVTILTIYDIDNLGPFFTTDEKSEYEHTQTIKLDI